MQLFIDIAGWSGAVIILVAYGLLSAERLSSRSALYQWLNIVGAAGFVVNSGAKGAYPSAALNLVWIAIAAFAVVRNRGIAAESTPR